MHVSLPTMRNDHLKSVVKILFSLVVMMHATATVLYGQGSYTTQLGKTILITEDYSYQDVIIEEGAYNNQNNPFEQPASKEYVIDHQERAVISRLEQEANQREITAYIRLLKADWDSTQLSTNYQLSYEEAVEIAQLVHQLPTVDVDKREQLYDKIDAMVSGPSAKVQRIRRGRADTRGKDIKLDERSAFDIEREASCTIVFDGFDEGLDAKRKETGAARLFGYTHPRLRQHFVNKDYIETMASMAKIDKDYYLVLRLDVASKSASKNYGAILSSERLRLRLIDGSNIYGQPVNNQSGTLEQYTGHTIYNPIIKIHKDDIKRLERIPLDDIGIVWTSGFENYEVYDIDILQNLTKCLRQ